MDTQRIEERVSLTGKTAVVVGGGTVIGRSIAEGLADTGAAVLLVADGDWEEANEMVNRIRAEGGKARALSADLYDSEDAQRVAQSAVEYFGSIDILVNNYCSPSLAAAPSGSAQWRQLMDKTLNGVNFYSRAAAMGMIAAGRGGRIINLSWMEEPPAYSSPIPPRENIAIASKRLAVDLAPYQINVNALTPGLVPAPHAQMQAASLIRPETSGGENLGGPSFQVQAPAAVDAEDVATIVLFLLSEAADNITGQLVVVEGGRRGSRG